MYTKPKNSLLFVIFILIILFIVSILIISVYNTKQDSLEEYKVSLNNILYDEEYNFVSLEDNAIIKKEWNDNFYLYLENNVKYSLGSETVLYDKSSREITIYGKVYQVFSNGDVTESDNKTEISKLDELQFFKLNDRKYLLIGEKITGPGISTFDYLIVSIDRAGNASLLNHSVNIKTINPLKLFVGDRIFDVANEKLIVGEEEIDLKKINGSTNEYVHTNDKNINSNDGNNSSSGGGGGQSGGWGGTSSNNTSSNESSSSGNSGTVNNKVYKEIINQIITLSGLIPTNTNKNSLYKNVSLRDVSIGSSYLDIFYSIIDPENKYLSVYLSIQKINDIERDIDDLVTAGFDCSFPDVECIYLDKDSSHYRKLGLTPSSEYIVSLNYLERGKTLPVVADVVTVVTSGNPTSVKIIEQDSNVYTYNVKLYNEYAFNSAKVAITDCNGNNLTKEPAQLDITNALTASGTTGKIERKTNPKVEFICLELIDVYDSNGNSIKVDSYHKIKTGDLISKKIEN